MCLCIEYEIVYTQQHTFGIVSQRKAEAHAECIHSAVSYFPTSTGMKLRAHTQKHT